MTICQFFGRFMSPGRGPRAGRGQGGRGLGEPDEPGGKGDSLIGRPLYEAFIRGYTMKQWQTDPRELPEGIITRLPVRQNFDTRYFEDKYEGLPVDGYARIFERMLASESIQIMLNTDFFSLRPEIEAMGKLGIYTGPVDRFFNYRFGPLGWRPRSISSARSLLRRISRALPSLTTRTRPCRSRAFWNSGTCIRNAAMPRTGPSYFVSISIGRGKRRALLPNRTGLR